MEKIFDIQKEYNPTFPKHEFEAHPHRLLRGQLFEEQNMRVGLPAPAPSLQTLPPQAGGGVRSPPCCLSGPLKSPNQVPQNLVKREEDPRRHREDPSVVKATVLSLGSLKQELESLAQDNFEEKCESTVEFHSGTR